MIVRQETTSNLKLKIKIENQIRIENEKLKINLCLIGRPFFFRIKECV